jgi:UDP-N-acetylglucosamine 3-dehydrogenase
MTGSPLRVGVIGCGAIATRVHLPGWRAAGAAVTAFTSGRPASAAKAAAEWGGGVAVDDWRELIRRDDVDAVDICTPNALHAPIAIAAAQAGKHVLVEKPIAISLAAADAMIDAARAADIILMTAHTLRFLTPFVLVRDAVAAGRIGEVTGFRAALGHAGPAAWAPDAKWFYERESAGGGALVDLGIHLADLLRAILEDEAAEVAAMLTGPPGALEDSAQLVLRFRRGAVGTLAASWAARPGPDHQLLVFGTEGTVALQPDGGVLLRSAGDGASERLELSGGPPPDVHRAFVDAVVSGAVPAVTGADGRAALAIVTAAYEAATTGTTVAVAAAP